METTFSSKISNLKKIDELSLTNTNKKRFAESMGKVAGYICGYAIFTTVFFLILGGKTKDVYISAAGIAVVVFSLGAVIEMWMKR